MHPDEFSAKFVRNSSTPMLKSNSPTSESLSNNYSNAQLLLNLNNTGTNSQTGVSSPSPTPTPATQPPTTYSPPISSNASTSSTSSSQKPVSVKNSSSSGVSSTTAVDDDDDDVHENDVDDELSSSRSPLSKTGSSSPGLMSHHLPMVIESQNKENQIQSSQPSTPGTRSSSLISNKSKTQRTRDHSQNSHSGSLKDASPNSCGSQLAGFVIPQRKRRDFIPNELKDEQYWERRRKNNLAAKRSREKRRLNDIVLETKVLELTNINNVLKLKLDLCARKYGFSEDELDQLFEENRHLLVVQETLDMSELITNDDSMNAHGMDGSGSSSSGEGNQMGFYDQSSSSGSSPAASASSKLESRMGKKMSDEDTGHLGGLDMTSSSMLMLSSHHQQSLVTASSHHHLSHLNHHGSLEDGSTPSSGVKTATNSSSMSSSGSSMCDAEDEDIDHEHDEDGGSSVGNAIEHRNHPEDVGDEDTVGGGMLMMDEDGQQVGIKECGVDEDDDKTTTAALTGAGSSSNESGSPPTKRKNATSPAASTISSASSVSLSSGDLITQKSSLLAQRLVEGGPANTPPEMKNQYPLLYNQLCRQSTNRPSGSLLNSTDAAAGKTPAGADNLSQQQQMMNNLLNELIKKNSLLKQQQQLKPLSQTPDALTRILSQQQQPQFSAASNSGSPNPPAFMERLAYLLSSNQPAQVNQNQPPVPNSTNLLMEKYKSFINKSQQSPPSAQPSRSLISSSQKNGASQNGGQNGSNVKNTVNNLLQNMAGGQAENASNKPTSRKRHINQICNGDNGTNGEFGPPSVLGNFHTNASAPMMNETMMSLMLQQQQRFINPSKSPLNSGASLSPANQRPGFGPPSQQANKNSACAKAQNYHQLIMLHQQQQQQHLQMHQQQQMHHELVDSSALSQLVVYQQQQQLLLQQKLGQQQHSNASLGLAAVAAAAAAQAAQQNQQANNNANNPNNPNGDNMPLKLRFKMLQLKTGEVN